MNTRHSLPAGRVMQSVCFLFLTLLFLSPAVFGSSASAEPVLFNGTSTAYIGEKNYMFLIDAQGGLHRLPTAIVDLVRMDEENVYCLTSDHRLYSVRLDGTSSALISLNPTEEMLGEYRKETWTQMGSLITVTMPQEGDGDTSLPGIQMVVTQQAVAACSAGGMLYYVESQEGETGAYRVKVFALDETLTDAASQSLINGASCIEPASMVMGPDALTIFGTDGKRIQIISAVNGESIIKDQLPEEVGTAMVLGGLLYEYQVAEDETLRYIQTENVNLRIATPTPTSTPQPTIVSVITATPARTVSITYAPTPTPLHETQDETTIRYGTKGTAVRKMQRRLDELGYPVGNIDGDFGKQTLFALNLFQDATGFANRRYATQSLRTKLYAKNAPRFDLYRPLDIGDQGLSVQIMQEMLVILGYGPEKVDGIYGKETAESVAKFQLFAGLTVDGEHATRDTLTALYTIMNPMDSPTPTPVPTASPAPSPTPVPTVVPTSIQTAIPTGVPTEVPTETPTQAPVEVPDETPTEEPTDEPTEAPTEVPTEEPTEAPTEEPTTAPTEVPT
ncbi:MAG: peptidoglycan-binding protein, partial [Clostridia bacterium]|nr:peptidoglycan-binding protein [Clostridia bacterium]